MPFFSRLPWPRALRAAARALAIGAALAGGCTPPTPTTAELVARTRAAMPGCQAGDAAQCTAACGSGGPNESCRRACNANDAPSCLRLATRLEREVDAPDAETSTRAIDPPDPEEVTDLYEKACNQGLGEGCKGAGDRILNGKGPGKRGAKQAFEMLRTGCQQLRNADSCCMLAQMNYRLAEGGMGARYRDEGRHWAELSERRGGKCAEPEPLPVFVR